MGKGKKKTKLEINNFKSDAGDISVAINFGAKYRVEVIERANSPLCGHAGVRYFDDDEKLVKFLKKVNAKYIGRHYIEVPSS